MRAVVSANVGWMMVRQELLFLTRIRCQQTRQEAQWISLVSYFKPEQP